MELKLTDINVCRYNKMLNTTCNAEADIIVPDTKPDIQKILCVNANCNLTEKYIRKGKMIFSGEVKFNILYVGDNDKSTIYTIEYIVPFNHQADLTEADEDCVCLASGEVSFTDFKVKNSRKLMAKAGIAITAQAMKHSSLKALESVEGEDSVPFRQLDIASDTLVNSKEFEFNVSDTISLPLTDENCQIYDFSVGINVEEIKTVNNKAIIKGVIPAKLFYLNGAFPSVYETECSFTEIADLDSSTSESVISSRFSVSDLSYEISGDENELNLEMDVTVKSSVKAYDRTQYSVTGDIYSPDYRYNVSKSESSLEKFTHLSPVQITLKDIVGSTQSDEGIAKVYYMNVYPSCGKIYAENSCLMTEGNVQTTVIYSNNQGEICSIHKNIPYKAELPFSENLSNAVFDVKVMPVSYGYVLSSDTDVQVRIVLKIDAECYSYCSAELITDFVMDKNYPIDKSAQPGVVVCYPDKNMTLWDYAVKFNTTCSEIAEVNNIEPDSELSEGRALLIPKRQIG